MLALIFASPAAGLAATAAGPRQVTHLVLSGEFKGALELLEKNSPKKAQGAWRLRLQFLSAYLQYRAKNYGEAAKLFSELKDDYLLLQNYVDFYGAASLREAGKAEAAVALLQKLLARPLPAPLQRRAGRELALAYCKSGKRNEAVKRMEELIQSESSETRKYRLRFDQAQCFLELGEKREAFLRWRNLYLSDPAGELSSEIQTALHGAPVEFRLSGADHQARAARLMELGRPELAVLDLKEAVRMTGAAPTLEQKLAEAHFKARQYREAAALLEKRRDNLPDLAKAYARSDQFDKAIATYRELRGQPGADLSEIDYKIAFLKMDQGQLAEADRLFSDLLERQARHPKRELIAWYLAWDAYRSGRYADAEARFSGLQAAGSGEKTGKRAAYWRARTLEKLGKLQAARSLWESLAATEKFSYYGFLSLKRLEKNSESGRPPEQAWVRELPRLQAPVFALQSLESKATQEGLLQELLLMGLWEDFLELGDLRAVAAGGGSNFTAEENGAWNRKYPAAYATLVSLFSQSNGLPQALGWAIMREESRFRPEVVSAANAIGLMQIIPPTGFEIARALGREGFDPQDLYRPVVNIEYGIRYLAMNLARFSGDLIRTIASYNAGPEAVERWTKARPNREWDEFVEEIPYAETQEYVRKVLRSFYLYRVIYGPSGG